MNISVILWSFLIGFMGIFLYLKRNGRKTSKFKTLPGPWGLPLIGNVLQMGKLPHLKLAEWSKKYGEIYQAAFGPIPVVIISSAKLMKEFFNDPNYVEKPKLMEPFDMYEGEGLGLINSNGETWEVHRRFLLRGLRDFGFGKSTMEGLILEEIGELTNFFKKMEGKPVRDFRKVVTIPVVNSLWSVLAGERFKQEDPKLLKLIETTDKVLDEMLKGMGAIIMNLFPSTKKICPGLIGYTKLREVIAEKRNWFEEMIEKHKKSLDKDNPRDFMDVYLTEVKNSKEVTSQFYGKRAERQLVSILSDLFFAGTETTASTMAFAILYLCKHLKVQEKLQKEIENVTGNTRKVTLSDKGSLPYLAAVLDEVLRISSIAPLGVHHCAKEDKDFKGFLIKKGSWIMANLYCLHHSKQLWGDPEVFRPERFLSSDGTKYLKSENLLPFQIGRRQCVGETLAKDTLFLFLGNIFQRFTIQFDPNEKDPSVEPLQAMVLQPQIFSVVMKDRNFNKDT